MRRWEYGNPEQVAIRRESYSCTGCKHKESVWGKEICNHPTYKPKEMRKCRHYEKGVADES